MNWPAAVALAYWRTAASACVAPARIMRRSAMMVMKRKPCATRRLASSTEVAWIPADFPELAGDGEDGRDAVFGRFPQLRRIG